MVRFGALKGLYDVEKTIGYGGFAKVKLAVHIATGEKVAIKIMEKSKMGDDLHRITLELEALKTLSHKHICKLYQVIETEAHFFIVIEYCSGGELFDHIVEQNRLAESRSRMFFRQIISAVAYLHSLGYAHRDLKPENVLLNGNRLLKLIDFGLCAKPEGGMESQLSTSCGSPTYAAPELVLGQHYIGSEIDVWSLGVLLYALLCGFLPFDDQNIDNLYRKILSGKYQEPSFLSTSSKQFIRSMLQIDPKKRITINAVLSHPWITAGGLLEPVEYYPENIKKKDLECVSVMARCRGVAEEEMWKELTTWNYDYNTATYLLLKKRKKQGSCLKLSTSAHNVHVKSAKAQRLKMHGSPLSQLNSQQNAGTPKGVENGQVKDNDVAKIEVYSPGGTFVEPRKPSSIRKPQKRIRSPTLEFDFSPVPAKKAATPSGSTPVSTPDRKRTPSSSGTPGSARRMLGTIEKSLNRVRHVLTPRKTSDDQSVHPVVLTNKDLCNVSTTQCGDPEFVINRLSQALQSKGIHCQRKGFCLRGKIDPNLVRRAGGFSFELEICYLPTLGCPTQNRSRPPTKSIMKNGVLGSPEARVPNPAPLPVPAVVVPPATVGIRRKRLKGDSWCYKRVCEEVLALAATDFKRATESAV